MIRWQTKLSEIEISFLIKTATLLCGGLALKGPLEEVN